MKVYVGIDPGKTGAVAIVHGSDVQFYENDWFFRYTREVADYAEVFVCVERAQAMPGQGVVSMFNYEVEYGKILGVLMSYNIPFSTVAPAVWKKEFSLLKQSKDKSVEIVRQIFPKAEMTIKDHHKAEALLLAEYARRKNM